jgi:hypothetical protein
MTSAPDRVEPARKKSRRILSANVSDTLRQIHAEFTVAAREIHARAVHWGKFGGATPGGKGG